MTIWSIFVNQPLKRKGTPKDSDRAAFEISGEAKRSGAVVAIKLNLESERKEDENVDSAAESGTKDYINEVSESSWWALIRDYLTPPDVLVMRTAGPKWNNAKLYGEFAALWFFLMTKDGSEEGAPVPHLEWPSLCFDYRQNFGSGFDNGMFNAGRLPDLTAFGNSGEWT